MISWFLNLFPQFRAMVAARIHAEDEARSATKRAERAEARVVELSDKLDSSQKKMIDVLSLRISGHRVFEQADPTVAAAVHKSAQPHRLQASDARQAMMVTFKSQIQEYFDANDAASG